MSRSREKPAWKWNDQHSTVDIKELEHKNLHLSASFLLYSVNEYYYPIEKQSLAIDVFVWSVIALFSEPLSGSKGPDNASGNGKVKTPGQRQNG